MGNVKKRKAPPARLARHVRLHELLKKNAGLSARSGGTVSVGDVTGRISWESGGVSVGDVIGRQIVVEGQFAELEATAISLQRGDVVEDYFNMGVDSAELSPRQGGLAKLTIRLVPSTAFETAEDPLRETVEIDMAQIEKPILTHPKLTGDMPANLALWRDGADEALKRADKYKDAAGNEKTLTETEKKWAAKIRAGVESYLVFAPVITLTGSYDGRPESDVPGHIDTPTVSVSGFEYLKTCDRVRQNADRTWERVQQWTGADKWDADIYTLGSD